MKSGSKRGPPPPPKAPEPMSLLDQIRAGKNLKKAEERIIEEKPKIAEASGDMFDTLTDALANMGELNYSDSDESDSSTDSEWDD